MKIKQTLLLIVLSVQSAKSVESVVQTINVVQIIRIANPSIEVRDAQSLTSRTAD